MQKLRLPEGAAGLLRCPICRTRLNATSDELICVNSNCKAHFPIIDGVPALINEQNSVFSINDFVSFRSTTFELRRTRLKRLLLGLMPNISRNIRARENYERFSELLLAQTTAPRVLVIGGSILGSGMEVLTSNHSFELIETDVSFGPRTMLICDAHDIPFEDESFDGVIVQAVLEHVVNPYRCAGEIHRTLKMHGLVYAETAFMQQVHMGRYDFTRFTHLGHRRLFREFEQIDSGATAGPGTVLAWSYKYFLSSFVSSKPSRGLIRILAHLTSFYLKYFDYFLIHKTGTLDAASAFYFMGRKGSHALSDLDLIKLYRGQFSVGAS